jgi:O-antigen/teichoic acid export membrane protein
MLVATTFLINSAFNLALGLLIARFLGPQGFGEYAIATAVAVVLNTLFLDWIRIAATRFYSSQTRENDPAVRGTLDAIFILSSFGLSLSSALAIYLGLDFGLAVALAAFAPAMGICNGLFDYHSALARARFDDRTYSVIVILKNVLSLIFVVGGAWWFQSPVIVAAGFVLNILASLLLVRSRLIDPDVSIIRPDWKTAGRYFLYGFPVILASMIYYLIPLWNRTAIASSLGFAASGQFSLAYDLAIRVVQTMGSAIDIILFQLAVKAEREGGLEAAKAQLARNMGLVLAGLAAVAGGYWLVLPSFEVLLVPQAFRGSFATVTVYLLPGLVCFALVQAALTPVFQIRSKTWPTVVAACAALVANALFVMLLPQQATIETYAAVQAGSYAVALIAAILLTFSVLQVRPAWRDLLAVGLAFGLMIAAVWPFRSWSPGWPALLGSASTGAVAFVSVLLIMNMGDCRGSIRRRLERRRAQVPSARAPQ